VYSVSPLKLVFCGTKLPIDKYRITDIIVVADTHSKGNVMKTTTPKRPVGRPRKINVDDINFPESHAAKMEHEIINSCREYLIAYGVIPPCNDIDESIQYSVAQLYDMFCAYQKVLAVLDDVRRMQEANAREIEVVMTAKFGIVTKGRGFRLNRRYLAAALGMNTEETRIE